MADYICAAKPDSVSSFPGAGRNVLTNPQGFLAFDMAIKATSDGDILRTGNGADTLIGAGGNDSLSSGRGDDVLIGDQGNDVLNGQVGRDLADYSGQQEGAAQGFTRGVAVTLNYNATAQVYAGSVTDNWGGTDRVTGIEEFRLSGLDDRVTLTGKALEFFAYDNDKPSFHGGAETGPGDVIDFGRLVMAAGTGLMVETTGDDREVSYANSSGNTGNSVIASGFEIVLGSKGNDTMIGGAGDDIFRGNAGADILRGMAGNDVLIFDRFDTEVKGGAGRDVAVFVGNGRTTFDMTAQGVEVLIGSKGADRILMTEAQDTLMAAGGDGNDTFLLGGNTGAGPQIVWGGGVTHVKNVFSHH